ncbi:MAG: tetratricopeptide repeat protein, partial [Cyanobacteriota bacterium]
YTQALALNPQDARALLSRALLWDRRGDCRQAIEDYTQVLPLNLTAEERLWVLNNRGYAYAQAGNLPAAIRDYTQVIERDPHHVQAYFNRALARSASGDWEGACQDFQMGLKLQGYQGRIL